MSHVADALLGDAQQFSMRHKAAPDSRTYREAKQALRTSPASEPVFPQRRRVGVYFQPHRKAKAALQIGLQRLHFEPGDIRVVSHHGVRFIDEPGNSYPHPSHAAITRRE